MKKCIDKPVIENILHKLWKKDTGFENIDIARIAYNRALQDVQKAIDSKQEEPVSDDLEKAAVEAFKQIVDSDKNNFLEIFKAGAKWKNKNLWKPADGDDLPEIGREVVAFQEDFPSLLKIVVAHRPNPEGYDGKSLTTGEVEHYTPKTYGKGGWNIPNVKWWLDCSLPNMEED